MAPRTEKTNAQDSRMSGEGGLPTHPQVCAPPLRCLRTVIQLCCGNYFTGCSNFQKNQRGGRKKQRWNQRQPWATSHHMSNGMVLPDPRQYLQPWGSKRPRFQTVWCTLAKIWALPGAPGLFIAPRYTSRSQLWNKTFPWKEKARSGELSPALQQPWPSPSVTCTLRHCWLLPSPAGRTRRDHIPLGSCSQRQEPPQQRCCVRRCHTDNQVTTISSRCKCQ